MVEKKQQATPTPLSPGTRLGEDGRYEVRQLIGEGGMGQVYRVRDRKFDKSPKPRYLAVKMLAKAGADPLILQRFLHEAQATSGLEHDHIVQVLDYGVDTERGQPFFVMPLLQGQDFSSYLKEKAPLEISHAVDIIVCIAAGVSKCHSVGIVHRDLKPSNIFLADTPSGVVPKLLDFGVSKYGDAELTNDGQLVGTFRYFSPEQAAGKRADARSDQYALALILYLALTRSIPFQELTGVPLLEAIKQGSIPRVRDRRPEVPEELDAALATAMSVNPDHRFPSVHEFARELVKFSSPGGIARAMWSNHFTKPPEVMIDPQFTAPVPTHRPQVQATAPSRAPTNVAGYDLPTRVNAEQAAPITATTTMQDDAGVVARRLAAETPPPMAPAPDVPRPPTSVTADENAAVSTPPSTAPVTVDRAASQPTRRVPRRVLLLGGALVGVAVAAAAGVALVANRGDGRAEPPPPVVSATANPAETAAQEPTHQTSSGTHVPAGPADAGPSTAVHVEQPPGAAAAVVAPAVEPPHDETRATKPKRRPKRSKSNEPRVEYTNDGLPIIPP